MPIKALEPNVVSKIAAGEVVQRPASVVKELVENSLDAGATHITVEVTDGGKRLIRISDNGMGVPADEVELAFYRHSTSKITAETDIETLSTLGFRGEALPSIAAVADVSVVTRHANELTGTAVTFKGGNLTSRSKQGAPQGTTITVQNLFQNVPARLKFLKSVSTENGHISYLVTQYSLAFPEVKFSLTVNGRTNLRSPGNGNLRDVLVEVYGLDIAQAMLEVHSSEPGAQIQVSGHISPSSVSRSSRDYLSFFINRRWVQSRMLTYAVEEAYQGMLMTGRHPIAVINLSLPPSEVDVNVHPSKSEVKFRSERDIFSAVQKAVRATLVGYEPQHGRRTPPPLTGPAPTSVPFPHTTGLSVTVSSQPAGERETTEPGTTLPILRVIGQFQNAYIMAEASEGLYLIDQHAAHERVRFERVRDQQSRKAVDVQGLLEPMTIELTAQQSEILDSEWGVLTSAGFSLEHFGERTYLLRAVPAMLKQDAIRDALFEILDSFESGQKSQWQYDIAASLACHGAIKSGDTLTIREMEDLIRQLEQTQSPRTCPHGRPTIMYFSASQIEREFGRR
ncbi:MAG: DNA mismatch repair endonuclease MutL [Chloroflexota bacterium]